MRQPSAGTTNDSEERSTPKTEIVEPKQKSNPELENSLKDAESAILAQEPERAMHIFDYVSRKFPQDLRAAVGIARIYFILGQTDRVIKQMTALSTRYPLASEPYAMLGNLYLSQGNLAQGQEQLKIATELDPQDSQSCYQLAQIAVIYNRRDEALLLLKQALQAAPQHNAARVLRARLLWAAGKIDDALLELNCAIAQDPNNAQLLSEKSLLLAARGRNPEAIEKLLQAYRLSPNSSEIQKQFITIYGDRRDWPNAQDAAVSWTQMEPKDAHSHLILGWCALMNHEFDDALAALKEAAKLAPEDPELHNIYGIALLERRKFDEALLQFKAALTLKPDYMPALLNMAAATGLKGQYGQAIEQLSGLELQYPGQQTIISLHAFMAARAGDLTVAERLNKESLSMDSQDLLSLITSGIIYRQAGKLEESAAVLQRVCRLSADSALSLCELSATLLAQGKGKEAIEMAQQALQIAPSNLDAKAALAYALIHQKNFDGAIYLLKECAVRNPKDLALRMTLADAQFSKGDKEGTELTLEKARTLFPDRSEPLVGLAKIAIGTHNYRQAEDLLEQALIFAPQNKQILTMFARNYYAMGKAESCLQQLSTLNDTDLSPEDILLKARCKYSLRDFAAACADYLKVIHIEKIINTNDILDFARASMEIGQVQRAQELLTKIEADENLLKQCKQAQIDKLQSDLRHALVQRAN